MKQIAFERNAKKLAVKKTIKVQPVQTIEDKIEEEYQRERAKAAKQFERDFPGPQGIYGRWFDSDMWMMYEAIKNKYLNEEKKKKKEFLWER